MKQATKPHKFMTVGQVALRSGVAVSTLHFYEAKGLISAHRSSGNQRRYSRDILRRVAIIKVARDLGFSLSEILELLAPIPAGHQPTTGEVSAMMAGWKSSIQARIEALSELRDKMDGCIGCGCLSKELCPLRNPSDELAASGSGPVLLEKAARLAARVKSAGETGHVDE
ncbi:redox-sensitive transcriptional activator SoxR [Breoghania sp.]|uniref:redox-sensitive transcriptional activator SoxR n=1 Tax=Breoghania sp. TaxID=2065378 RepID=UPI002AA8604B|nr:redox-sensitive transcriptional activator SoxR [Breoghania sp.]